MLSFRPITLWVWWTWFQTPASVIFSGVKGQFNSHNSEGQRCKYNGRWTTNSTSLLNSFKANIKLGLPEAAQLEIHFLENQDSGLKIIEDWRKMYNTILAFYSRCVISNTVIYGARAVMTIQHHGCLKPFSTLQSYCLHEGRLFDDFICAGPIHRFIEDECKKRKHE